MLENISALGAINFSHVDFVVEYAPVPRPEAAWVLPMEVGAIELVVRARACAWIWR